MLVGFLMHIQGVKKAQVNCPHCGFKFIILTPIWFRVSAQLSERHTLFQIQQMPNTITVLL